MDPDGSPTSSLIDSNAMDGTSSPPSTGNSMDRRRWLPPKKMSTSSETMESMKMVLMFLLIVMALYMAIVTAIGYCPNCKKADNMNKFTYKKKLLASQDDQDFEQNSSAYFTVSGLVSLAVIIVTIIGVLKENSVIAMLTSIYYLLSVTQSISNILFVESYVSFLSLMFSPISAFSLLSALLAIYTAIIWSSSFETPHDVIDDYKKLLDVIRDDPRFNALVHQGPDIFDGGISPIPGPSYIRTSNPQKRLKPPGPGVKFRSVDSRDIIYGSSDPAGSSDDDSEMEEDGIQLSNSQVASAISGSGRASFYSTVASKIKP